MNIQEVKKKRNSYEKEFKEIEKELEKPLSEKEFKTFENKQNDLYKKLVLCNIIIDSYNASDEDDVLDLLKILDEGSVL